MINRNNSSLFRVQIGLSLNKSIRPLFDCLRILDIGESSDRATHAGSQQMLYKECQNG